MSVTQSVDTSAVSPEDFLRLSAELKEIQIAQARGDLAKAREGESPEQFSTRTAETIRRGVELTSILRRTNTGAPKARGSKKAKGAKDLEAITNELLG